MEEELTEKYLLYAYNELNKSTYELAKMFNTYPNKIRRMLIDAGATMKTKAEAQKSALESGRHSHPTKGKKRSESEKLKISEGVAKIWQNMNQEEKDERSKIAKENWENMSNEEREALQKKAGQAVRKTAELGSKLERYLLIELQRKGYKVSFHTECLVSNEKLQMDLLLPDIKPPVVIEIDGPAHFLPIWGEEALKKHLNADKQKNGLLLEAGYIVIRIKHLVKNLSEIHKRKVLTKTLEVLEYISMHTLLEEKRLIEIEVK